MNCIAGAEVVCEQYSADCSGADVREQQVDPPVLLLDACDLLSWLRLLRSRGHGQRVFGTANVGCQKCLD